LTVQSTDLSLLDMDATVYASDQTTVLGSATSSTTNRTGSTLTITVSGVSDGQLMYIKVAPHDTTAFGTGAFAMTLNFGTGSSPTVPLPNTQTPNGNPLHSGGGQADSPGHDNFPDVDSFKTAAPHTASGRAMPTPIAPADLGAQGAVYPPSSLPSHAC